MIWMQKKAGVIKGMTNNVATLSSKSPQCGCRHCAPLVTSH